MNLVSGRLQLNLVSFKTISQVLPERSYSCVRAVWAFGIDGRRGPLKRRPRLIHGLFDEIVSDAPRRMLVEDGIHESYLGRATSRLRLGWTILKAPEATAAGQRDVGLGVGSKIQAYVS